MNRNLCALQCASNSVITGGDFNADSISKIAYLFYAISNRLLSGFTCLPFMQSFRLNCNARCSSVTSRPSCRVTTCFPSAAVASCCPNDEAESQERARSLKKRSSPRRVGGQAGNQSALEAGRDPRAALLATAKFHFH